MADLTTLEDVKSWLPIPSTTAAEDPLLQELITSVSADFLRAIERPDLLEEDYTEVRTGDGGTRLSLRHWPITDVTSLTVAGTAVAASADKMARGYYFDEDLDPERRTILYLAGGLAFTDAATVKLEYTAGYADAPEDVAQAVKEWVCARYKGRPNATAVARRSTEGADVRVDLSDAPETTKAVIARYKVCWPSQDKRTDDRNYRVTRINRTYNQTDVNSGAKNQ
jgi:hypothetical protein